MAIRIDSRTRWILQRMAELDAISKEFGDEADYVHDEYGALLREAATECLPFVELMARAGLFMLRIETSPDTDPKRNSGVDYEVAAVIGNGGIDLHAGEAVGWTLTNPSKVGRSELRHA